MQRKLLNDEIKARGRAGALVRRDAGRHAQTLSKSVIGNGAGHQRADRSDEADEGGASTRRRSVKVLDDETLRLITRELMGTVRHTARRVLRKHGYPLDKQEKATLTVLDQAEQIAKDWAG